MAIIAAPINHAYYAYIVQDHVLSAHEPQLPWSSVCMQRLSTTYVEMEYDAGAKCVQGMCSIQL